MAAMKCGVPELRRRGVGAGVTRKDSGGSFGYVISGEADELTRRLSDHQDALLKMEIISRLDHFVCCVNVSW